MPPRLDPAADAPTQRISSPTDAEDRRWWILGVLVLSLVVVMTANTSLNVAIPSIVRDTGATATELQWIVDAFALVFAGMLLTAGAMGDRFGRKGALLIGLAIFGTMSLLATLADDPAALITIRAVQGLGAALLMPGTLSILAAVFPPEERSRAIAIWAGFAGSGAAIGIVGSGWLLEHFWWGSVFFVNVPIVAAAIILVCLLVPTSRDPRGLPLDGVGALLSIVALGSLLFGIIEGPERGWADELTVGGFAVAAAGLAAFVWWERRRDFPMLDLQFFASRPFTVGTTTIALTFFAMFGLFFLMTQYLQSVRGYTPLEAGVRILPMMAAMIPAATLSARWAARFGSRAVLSTGLALVTSGLLVIASLGTGTSYWVMAAGLVLVGTGMGNVAAPATGAVMTSLPVAKAGVGSAVNDTAREVGGALGIAVLGSLLTSGYRANLDSVAGVPATSLVTSQRSVGAAVQEATRLGGDTGTALADAARSAYTDAMGTALLVAAAVTLMTIALVRRSLPGRDRQATPTARAASTHAVEARDLVKHYGATTALGGVDFAVPAGTVMAVLGPNGAGKTTAVRILATLTDADQGEAIVAGFDVRTQAAEVRRRIGLTAQDATVDPLLTGRENLVMLGELHQLSRPEATRRAAELLDDLSLADAADRVVSGYSGGMRRRLDLAATLVGRPEVLFLDEPTTGLDPRGRNELWDVLDTLVDRGTTVVLTTQYLEEAERLADDIIVIDHGEVIARGDAASLKRQVGGNHLHVAVVDGSDLAHASRIVATVTGSDTDVDLAARTVQAPTGRGVEAVTAVASALANAGIAVDDLSLRQPTLDEVFLTLTGSPPSSSDELTEQIAEEATA